MKPASFAYHRPRTIDEAIRLLAELAPDDGRVLAGGQSLVPMMAFRVARPHHLVDINDVEGLDRLRVEDGVVHIGARVRHAMLDAAHVPGPMGVFLGRVMRNIAHAPIRSRGTFCGSLAHSDPASEWCLVAATLDATLIARSASGTREIAARDFFEAIMTTSLRPDELLTEVRLPALALGTRFGFCEFNRRSGDFAIASVLVTLRVEGGCIVDPRFGVGGVEPFPRRLDEIEEFLTGRPLVSETIEEAGVMAAACLDPLEDASTSGTYRRQLVESLTRSVFEQIRA